MTRQLITGNVATWSMVQILGRSQLPVAEARGLGLQSECQWRPLNKYYSTLTTAWISNHIHYKVWEEITYPFSGCIVDAWKWTCDYLSVLGLTLIHVNKWAPGIPFLTWFNCYKSWINDYIHCFMWGVITHPCLNFIVGYGWLITSHCFMWVTSYPCFAGVNTLNRCCQKQNIDHKLECI